MSRAAALLYGIISYAIGMGGLAMFMVFAGGWGFPQDINAAATVSWPLALTINILLVALFAVQHSVMARQSFKEHLTKLLPAGVERSTYVLMSGVVSVILCLLWQPMDGMIWNIDAPAVRMTLFALQIAGWVFAVSASFMINHFELFGLQQAHALATDREIKIPPFTTRLGYRLVRHPIQLGLFIGMWATPTMSLAHLVLALGMTAYMRYGLMLEERDLAKAYGQDYLDYQQRVRMMIPIPRVAR